MPCINWLFKKALFFPSSFRFTTNLRERYSYFPCVPCPYTCTASPTYQHPPPEWDICYRSFVRNLHWHIRIAQCPQVTLGLTLGVIHPTGLDKCISTCIHPYGTIQRISLNSFSLWRASKDEDYSVWGRKMNINNSFLPRDYFLLLKNSMKLWWL